MPSVRSSVSWFLQPHRKFLATGSRMAGTGVPAAPVAAYFSLLECPEKSGRSARIMGPFQQVRDYIRMGGKQQPKARQLAARQGQLAVLAGLVSRLIRGLFEAFPQGVGSWSRCRPADRL